MCKVGTKSLGRKFGGRLVANQVSDQVGSGAFRFRSNLILIRSFGQNLSESEHSHKHFDVPFAAKKHAKTRRTLPYHRSWLDLNPKASDCTRPCNL